MRLDTSRIPIRGDVRNLTHCCRKTINDYARHVDCALPQEQFQMGCDYCQNVLTWKRGAWEVILPVWHPDDGRKRVEAEASDDATAERRKQADAITHGQFSKSMKRMYPDG